jgi:serine/threonine-protein kinase
MAIEMAAEMFEKAIELDPDFSQAYANLSRAHMELYNFGYDRTDNRLLKAKETVDRALEIQPDLPLAHRALGLYYYWGHLDYDRALEEFDLVLKSHPNDPEILSETAFIWRRQGKFKQALANQIKAAELNPQDYRTLLELAITYLSLRNYSEALSYFDRCISYAPDQRHAYMFKTLCYWSWNGDLEKARAVLEEMPAIQSSISTWMFYYQALFEKNYQEALNEVSSLPFNVLADQHGYAPKSLLEGLAFYLMGDSLQAHTSLDSARIFLEQAAVDMPDNPGVYRSLGLAYAALGRKDDAIREGKKAVDLCPVSKDVMRGPDNIRDLVVIYFMVGEYDNGFDQLDYLLSIPNWYSIQFFKMDAYNFHLSDHPRFIELVKKYSGEGS